VCGELDLTSQPPLLEGEEEIDFLKFMKKFNKNFIPPLLIGEGRGEVLKVKTNESAR
jgi:hypothetical protein